MLDHTDCHGVQLGSSIERMAIERPIEERAAAFKAATPARAPGLTVDAAACRFAELMAEARRGGYAVGYFESWNLESLLAVADAAEAERSPVILGFSGIYLPHPGAGVRDRARALRGHGARRLPRADASPPASSSTNRPTGIGLSTAIDAGFDLVMFSDDGRRRRSASRSSAASSTRAHAARCRGRGGAGAACRRGRRSRRRRPSAPTGG